ncbi:metallophosphoesterase [Actinocorallia sp. A-T 12471]|uniref:metallophosphoesterase n=1 Tax=Actinocorallia sp. A-T 12471 TaxID=3089813 RepID=UPI0029CC69BF|nr:metallophosphoesterase [Actinocorallia sp. A-T 12471]MDX6739596.1 metallophosphoesterase [Actinocorallia sp. A-T 12471]
MAVDSAARRPSALRPVLIGGALVTIMGLLFGVPWWTLVAAPGWGEPAFAVGSALFAGAALATPFLMFAGQRPGGDRLSVAGSVVLGAAWVLFSQSVLAVVVRVGLEAVGVADAARITAAWVAAVSAGLLVWGYYEAMRVPRVKEVDVVLPRLGKGLDGARIVLLTDTHYGPTDRAAWSAKVTEVVNALEPDVVAHTGDIADGTVAQRRAQAAPLADVEAKLARVYVTGNHEYYGDPLGWLAHMRDLGWQPLHNHHVVVERGGDRLVLAGIDDHTAHHSGHPGHRADLTAALDGADPDLPVVLLAHQPKQVAVAEAAGIDLQLSGHTHGGQIWPFHHFVRIDQPEVAGLSRRTDRTQIYTSRGTGFWGPPFRVFAPSEITLLKLRAA